MTKTTRETEKEKNANVMAVSLVLTIFLVFMGSLVTYVWLHSEISKLPHKYCNNVTMLEEIECPGTFNICAVNDNDCWNKFKGNLTVKGKILIKEDVIICYLQVTKEVCEIK